MPRPKLPPGAKRVRLDLTLPAAMVDRIDALARGALTTRSAYLEDVLAALLPEAPKRRRAKAR